VNFFSLQTFVNKIVISLPLLMYCNSAVFALPIGFGYNQGDLKFMEMRSPNFTVYFDQRAPQDARIAVQSLEAARPSVERWFDVKRSSPLIVNMSAISDNASFANFVTDSIELQTMGQGGRDLAWHEYIHSMMYQHLDNIFGPAGAIIHLPWMEAWFLEGLAEAVSVAIGSDEQAGVERYHSLTGDWPSWDRIHSLYTSGPFNYRGYATSGAFVAWILRTYGAAKLPDLLRTFRAKSMPWYWPWALMPLNSFLPMDEALKSLTGKSGKELYEQYQVEAAQFWKGSIKSPVILSGSPKKSLTASPWAWQFNGKKLIRTSPPRQATSYHLARTGKARAWVNTYYAAANKQKLRIVYKNSSTAQRTIDRDSQWIDGPWIGSKRLWWIEKFIEKTSLCSTSLEKEEKSSVSCLMTTNLPERLRILGSRQNTKQESVTLWLAKDKENLTGDTHEVLEIDLETSEIKTHTPPVQGRPVSLAYSQDATWMLAADRSWRHLVKLDSNLNCSGVVEISDFPVRIVDSKSPLPHVILFSSNGYAAHLPDSSTFPVRPCRQFSKKTSPLLVAMNSRQPISLDDAVESSNIWLATESSQAATIQNASEQSAPVSSHNAKSSSKIDLERDELTPDIKPARWRGRPVLAFPWLGADDPLGPQLGIISVPLMDHMQNETLRATVLFGLASRFPYQDFTLITNRFKPTWSVTGFRSQTYNGRYRDKITGNILSGFLEEQGMRIDASYAQRWNNLSLIYEWGFKGSNLKPYIGPTRLSGHLNEPYLGVTAALTGRYRTYSTWSLRTRGAPAAINRIYQYDVVSSSLTTGVRVGAGKFEAGLEASRTRGPKRRDLQEMYQPLKTLIPGTGAGLNQNSFALTEDQGLFSPVFGENQARARVLATHPVIENFDKFLGGLIYVDRLVGSGFFNYGTAWRGADLPETADLTAAQGYSLDLFMDNKGVNFNFGGGAGQVLGRPWQAYWTFGFDALF
jgi:dsDNA-binding SOS-regulon protein